MGVIVTTYRATHCYSGHEAKYRRTAWPAPLTPSTPGEVRESVGQFICHVHEMCPLETKRIQSGDEEESRGGEVKRRKCTMCTRRCHINKQNRFVTRKDVPTTSLQMLSPDRERILQFSPALPIHWLLIMTLIHLDYLCRNNCKSKDLINMCSSVSLISRRLWNGSQI